MSLAAMSNVVLVMPLAEQRGGAELALSHLLQHGRALGVRWHLVFFEDGPMVRQARDLNVDAEVIPSGRLRQPLRMWRCIRRIAAVARRVQAVAIFGWMPKAQLYGGPAAMLAGVPAVWFQHVIASWRSSIDVLASLLPARNVLTCSRAAARAQERLWPRRDTRVVYPPVDLDHFDSTSLPSPAELRRELGLPLEGPLIGIVGRLQWWKGFHVLIDAMPRILKSHPNAHCVLVGGEHAMEPEYPNLLRERIASLGLSGRVSMVGLQNNPARWMAAMDVVVHASDREPFGMVVIEAMALGKPVVASDSAGPTEIITAGVNGLLTRFGDANALAAAVLRYLDDPNFARQVGEAARQRAAAFSAPRFAAEVAEVVGAHRWRGDAVSN
jgi:glycosyltransferase involved in cell wall biosynthesis